MTTHLPTARSDRQSPLLDKYPNHEREAAMSARKFQPATHYRKILGVQFFVGNAQQAVNAGMKGGLVVAPAAPSLLDIHRDRHYRDALLESDLAITDSGFMVMIWNTMVPDAICRVSGLEYLKLLLSQPELREPGATFWVMPSKPSMRRNLHWLRGRGLPVEEADCHVAPKYPAGAIHDEQLLKVINDRRPAHVVIAVGGGVQERLGLFLKRHCEFSPGIHCTGAAIAFLSGDQTSIPDWVDHYRLGWLLRCASDPRRFVPRYARAFQLAMMLWRYRDQLPA
jgi:UDP-N-acetyl-D-mannosaminuronic acid transferase (WecB/TagA/CpsF family)